MKTLITSLIISCALLGIACSKQETATTTAPVKSTQVTSAAEGCKLNPPPEPVMCTMDWNPVCGCDGKTYGNVCAAKATGVPEYTDGECGGGGTE